MWRIEPGFAGVGKLVDDVDAILLGPFTDLVALNRIEFSCRSWAEWR
jgi:hypothetical protein